MQKRTRSFSDVSTGVTKVEEYLRKLSFNDLPLERTLTPGGPTEEATPGTASRWPSYAFTPSPLMHQKKDEDLKDLAQGSNLFDSEGE